MAVREKLEDSSPLFRVPLFIFGVRRFHEEALKLQADFLSLSIPRKILRVFLLYDPPIISAVSTIFNGLPLFSDIVWRFSSGSCLSQKVPYFIGAPELLERLIRACK